MGRLIIYILAVTVPATNHGNSNQEDFESNISGTLRDLCNGPLGPAEMVLLVSFRNAAGISTIV